MAAAEDPAGRVEIDLERDLLAGLERRGLAQRVASRDVEHALRDEVRDTVGAHVGEADAEPDHARGRGHLQLGARASEHVDVLVQRG